MLSFFKLSYNPQAFRASLILTLCAFLLDFLFFHLIISSNFEGLNQLLLSIAYYLILFFIIRYTLEIYIIFYIETGVKKVLGELNDEILKDGYNEKNLENAEGSESLGFGTSVQLTDPANRNPSRVNSFSFGIASNNNR